MSNLDETTIERLELVKYPDPRLRAPNVRVECFDERLKSFVDAMYEKMSEFRGVGLAAPQVGVNLMLFAANPTGEPDDNRVYINPVLCEFDGRVEDDEGCLSFPGVSCRIKRYAKTTVTAQDVNGESFTERGAGLLARIFQHEYDHLEGRLLVDRMSMLAKMSNRSVIRRLEDDFEGGGA